MKTLHFKFRFYRNADIKKIGPFTKNIFLTSFLFLLFFLLIVKMQLLRYKLYKTELIFIYFLNHKISYKIPNINMTMTHKKINSLDLTN